MTTKNKTTPELFEELTEILNKIHKQEMKVSWSSIGKIVGFSEQRARAKFLVFTEYLKKQKSNELWAEAIQAGSTKGFSPAIEQFISNTSQTITWKCSEGHEFTCSIRKMKYSYAVCPHCKKNKNN